MIWERPRIQTLMVQFALQLDVGGGATADAVKKAFELLLTAKNVRSIFVNICEPLFLSPILHSPISILFTPFILVMCLNIACTA